MNKDPFLHQGVVALDRFYCTCHILLSCSSFWDISEELGILFVAHRSG